MILRSDVLVKSLKEIQQLLRENKQRILSKYDLTAIGIFGSYSRGQQTRSSDLDVLIDYDRLLMHQQFMDVKNVLSELMGLDVDLVALKCLKPEIRSRVLADILWI